MDLNSSAIYFARRERESLIAAKDAAGSCARRVHLDLVIAYRKLAGEIAPAKAILRPLVRHARISIRHG